MQIFLSIPSTCLSVASLRLHQNMSPTQEPRPGAPLPPGPPHRAWEQAAAWSLFTADGTTPVQWPPGSRGKPVTTASHDLKSHPAPKSVPGSPLQGHPTSLPVSLPPSPPQCLLFAICPQLDLLLQGDWGLHKGTSPHSGLLGAQGSSWQISGAQNPSANWLVSRKLVCPLRTW